MAALVIAFCALVGLLIGSFLNVVIWRVPRGESVVAPPSACPRCGNDIATIDNIPVVSWLVLRGRCRNCRQRISARYPLVELGTAALFGLAGWLLGISWELPAFLYLAAISVALAMIDIDVHRLPNAIVLPSYVLSAILLGGAATLNGEPGVVLRLAAGGLGLYLFYFVLALIYPAGMGFGDVKLAGVLGMYLAFFGWAPLVVGAFLGFLVGGMLGGVLLMTGRAGRKSKIPFGPFMLLGAWLGIVTGQPVADWYLRLVGLS